MSMNLCLVLDESLLKGNNRVVYDKDFFEVLSHGEESELDDIRNETLKEIAFKRPKFDKNTKKIDFGKKFSGIPKSLPRPRVT